MKQSQRTPRLGQKYRVLFFFLAGALLALAALLLAFSGLAPGARTAGSIALLLAALGILFFGVVSPVLHMHATAADILSAYRGSDEGGRDNIGEVLQQFQMLLDREYALELLRKQAELDALQSQINPHFLYNTLESIRGHALSEGADNLADMAKALSEFFRYSINRNEKQVTVADEIQNVQSYLKIQNYRFGDKYRVEINTCGDDAVYACRLPRLTLQPIVENALLHGLRDSLNPAETIRIELEATGTRLAIRVSDDGSGMDDATLDRLNNKLRKPLTLEKQPANPGGQGIALVNINDRLRLLYGTQYGLFVMSTQGVGTTVELTLPNIAE